MAMSAGKSIVQSLWMMWESVFDFITLFRSKAVCRYGICKLVVKKHRGNSVTCQDGHTLLDGEWIGELHLDNRQVLQLTRSVGAERAGLQIARKLRRAMKQISQDLDTNPELTDVEVLTGITLLHRGIIHGIGFEQHPIKSTWQRRFFGIYLRLLLRAMHPEGKQRITYSKGKLSPKMLIISKKSLQERFSYSHMRPEYRPLVDHPSVQDWGRVEASWYKY